MLHQPSLIFMDVVMPGQGGFAACRTLKKSSMTGSIPIVMVTSKVSDSDKFWGRKQGADDYIGKPYSPELVTSAIRRFISG